MKILTAEQMRRIDERAREQFGIPVETLMDNAGLAVVDALCSLYPSLPAMNLLIVCGKGNNGGDGITAARYLKQRSIGARVVLLADKTSLKGAARHHLEAAEKAGVAIEQAVTDAAWDRIAGEIRKHGLILDALLGTGLQGAARGLVARAIQAINDSGVPVVAIDIPSGLSGDSGGISGPAIRAEHTIALACPKIPHVFEPASALCGALHVVDIGIPAMAIEAEGIDLSLISEGLVAPMVPVRESDSHKGDYGRLLVIAGSTGRTGAAAMVCLAALRSGAGLVTGATAASAQPVLAGQVMEMMTESLPETPAGALSAAAAPFLGDLMKTADVLAVGPGLTANEETATLVREIVGASFLPVVLDADGLNAYAGRASDLNGESRVMILTPHPGEMARLLSRAGSTAVTTAMVQADRIGIARRFAADRSCYLVLKGHNTLVAEPGGQVWINPTGNPGMATAGSGDVLTGVLAGLLGQGLSPLESCLLGVYVHGLAGDLASGDYGETSLIARDIIDYLPEAYLHLERAAE
ncbi:MAG TPA: NAD(P)H-hydrate dehydratase [Patescibacteria group bacterium]|nr:NAD(P)H-hydrate dehydratase [Patescibacteria group bacterium]